MEKQRLIIIRKPVKALPHFCSANCHRRYHGGLGTSLPELIATIAAVRKGHPEICVGNVVGAHGCWRYTAFM